jgi:hypothetical protein
MNMMQMMQQAQKMQKRLKEVQDELAQTEFTATSAGGAVEVTCTGGGRFKAIKIKPEALNPDEPSSVDTDTLEMLEDIIAEAILSASEKAAAEADAKMKAVTGGINIPGLL